MLPVAPLMKEHRLIERMIKLMRDELKKATKENRVNSGIIDTAVDFIRIYADKCHHGKEEDILFRDLAKKDMTEEHERIMNELIEEHVQGRKTTKKLAEANKEYRKGKRDSIATIIDSMTWLVDFYPKHIEKEDKHFFIPVMKYFNDKERSDMLNECWEFDKEMIHKKYRQVVETLEKS